MINGNTIGGCAMRIDAHQHYWDISRDDYGWITQDLSLLYRNFYPSDLKNELIDHNIDRTILVQAAASISETEFLLKLGNKEDSIAGIVGWLDLEKDNYKEQLKSFQSNSKFLGIRIMMQDMEDETIVLNQRYLEAFTYFANIGLPVDLLVTHQQLGTLVKLMEEVPHLRGVIDHLGKPDIHRQLLHPWCEKMKALSSYPELFCKISGMITESRPNWETDDFKLYIDHIIECFGSHRIMMGSDWPVCLLAGSYTDVITIIEESLREKLSKHEMELLFGTNAYEFYKLGEGDQFEV